MNQEQINMMVDAYHKLINIEMHLRSVIDERLTTEYGIHWNFILSRRIQNNVIRKDFNELEYYEVVSYFKILPSLSSIYPTKFVLQMRSLVGIRNKIAHHKLLSNYDYNKLNEVYQKLCLSMEAV